MVQPTLEPLGIETQLWSAADTLRGNVDAAEYKHVVLGLLFLKYISDDFEELHTSLQQEAGADPEDRDEYLAENVFWVPQEARWSRLQAEARQPTIGTTIDNAMLAIERENHSFHDDSFRIISRYRRSPFLGIHYHDNTMTPPWS